MLKDDPQDSKKIFTCIQADKFEQNGNFVKEKQLFPTKLKLLIENYEKEEKIEAENEFSSPKSSMLEFQQNLEDFHNRFSNIDNFQSMFIFADLESPSVLFSIKYRKDDGLLLVFPDFNEVRS